MASRFLMQIVDRESGEIVQFEPGLQVEREFVNDCVERVLELWSAREPATTGVRAWFTRAVDRPIVAADVRAGIESSILALKAKVRA